MYNILFYNIIIIQQACHSTKSLWFYCKDLHEHQAKNSGFIQSNVKTLYL